MRDINNMSRLFYVFENLAWSFLSYKIFSIYLFTNILGFDTFASLQILVISMAVSVIVGVMITIKHRRNSLSTAINVSLPLAIYSMIAYYRYVSLLIVILLVLSVLVSVLYIVMTRQYSKSKASKRNKKFSIKRYSFLGVRTITTFACSFLIVLLLGSSLTGLQLYRPTKEAVTDASVDYDTYLDKNKKTILLLEPSRWSKLNNTEKLNVLNCVIGYECLKLGINNSISLRSKASINELLGFYNRENHSICINTKHLETDDSFEVLNTTLHELYHEFESCAIELYDSFNDSQKKFYIFSTLRQWQQEFSNYKGGYFSDFNEYYQQECESSARSYAQFETERIENIINKY